MTLSELKKAIQISGAPFTFEVLQDSDGTDTWYLVNVVNEAGQIVGSLDAARGQVRTFRSLDTVYRIAQDVGIHECRILVRDLFGSFTDQADRSQRSESIQ